MLVLTILGGPWYQLHCEAAMSHDLLQKGHDLHFYRLPQTADENYRYGVVCDGCDIECEGCTIEDDYTIPVCSALLEHTTSESGTATLERLVVDPGYWRATNTSRDILECFNKNACRGGVTGNKTYCSTGYEGPCER